MSNVYCIRTKKPIETECRKIEEQLKAIDQFAESLKAAMSDSLKSDLSLDHESVVFVIGHREKSDFAAVGTLSSISQERQINLLQRAQAKILE